MKIYNNTNITYSAIEHNSRKNTKQNVPADLEKKMTQYTDTLSISKTGQESFRHLSSVSSMDYQNRFEKEVTDIFVKEDTESVKTDSFEHHVNRMAEVYNKMKNSIEEKYAGNISYDKATKKISFGAEGMKIDLGGIAKGYTSSRIMDIYKENGISSGLVNLGGNVQALGTKTDGTKWKIAVQSPDDTEDYLGILSVQDKAVITSGGYERYFEQDGVTYHHIIDPKTGYPAESGLVSVTIVSKDGTLADGLSTSLFIMGEEKAADFWRKHKDDFDAILMSDNGTLYVTEGLENDFSTERTVEIIR